MADGIGRRPRPARDGDLDQPQSIAVLGQRKEQVEDPANRLRPMDVGVSASFPTPSKIHADTCSKFRTSFEKICNRGERVLGYFKDRTSGDSHDDQRYAHDQIGSPRARDPGVFRSGSQLRDRHGLGAPPVLPPVVDIRTAALYDPARLSPLQPDPPHLQPDGARRAAGNMGAAVAVPRRHHAPLDRRAGRRNRADDRGIFGL